jgi:hypothetical protein
MSTQERRHKQQTIGGRRILADRRNADNDEYNGEEHRSGNERRTIIDRRNIH